MLIFWVIWLDQDLTNLTNPTTSKIGKVGLSGNFCMLVISAFKNLKVISKLMVNLILNCFENSLIKRRGVIFLCISFRARRLKLKGNDIYMKDSLTLCYFTVFFTLGLWQVETNYIYINIISQMQISCAIGLIDCVMVLSQDRKALSLFQCIPSP